MTVEPATPAGPPARDRRLGYYGVVGIGAAVWIVAAILLWRTTVPSLDLDGFDQNAYFNSREISRAHDYEQGTRLLWLLATVATIVALVVLMRVLPRSVRGIGLGRIGTAVIVGMVVLVTTWAVSLPFSVADLWWQHHWGLGPFNVWDWLISQRAALAANAIFALMTIVLLVALAARFRRFWWIPGAAVFIVLVALLVFLLGWLLVAGTHRLDDPQLRADVERIEAAEGVNSPVRVQDVSDWTDQANAFTVGFGPSTNVVLWDTLLDDRFSRGEVDVVIAHELGHVKSDHVLKGIGIFALFAFPALFVVAEVTRRRGGMWNPANLPLAVLVVTVVALASAPLQNAISRRYEAEADWRALKATNDPAAMKRLFQGFQDTSLQEPNPPLWAYLWFDTHPTLMQRIAMAERYDQRTRSG